jgi:hypothetical protein
LTFVFLFLVYRENCAYHPGMKIDSLIEAAGSVAKLSQMLQIPYPRVAKWRDRKKIPELAQIKLGKKMARILSKNTKVKNEIVSAKLCGSEAQESKDDGHLCGDGGQADGGFGTRARKARSIDKITWPASL